MECRRAPHPRDRGGCRIAAALDVAKRSPCLVVERQTWSADQPVTHVRFTYAGDSHALIARFTVAG